MVEEKSEKAVKVRIVGRVQGVFYRSWTEDQARELGISGWVRNRLDGSVEALFVGAPGAVEEMLARCRDGPPHAVVERMEVAPAVGMTPARFEVKPTV